MTVATPLLRRTVALMLAGAALAACATSQESDPGTTLTSTTSTSSTSTTSTTVAATTTEAPATTAAETTTTAAPTTAAPVSTLPPGPTGDVFPLYIGDSSGALTPLGTWDGGDWAAASDDEPLPESGREFTVSRLSGAVDGTVDGATEACPIDGRVGPTISPDAGPAVPPEAGYNGVALPPPGWPLQPRRVAELDDDIPGYQELGEAAFDSADVDATAGTIEQLVIADLDGDGNTEALVVFERVQEAESGTPEATLGSPGDFSGVLLVDTASRASTTVLSSIVLASDDEISIEFLEQYRILDVADYNGDGRMEIAVSAWYYEGAGVAVFSFNGGELDEVLATGCGA
ncbi:MAG: hypothetical protein AAFY28_00090 [Actinomycetota bacterium]